MRFGRMAVTAAVAAWLALGGPAHAAAEIERVAPDAEKAQGQDRILPDPAVLRGRLANGLRYAVMRNDRPAGGVSVRLVVGVGAFNEEADERGAAHFVEHMVFEPGARGAEYIARFQAAGVTFGRDQNAVTNLFDTDYKLDLPAADARSVALAFRWLRDVASGAAFPPEAVEREKGVLLAERSLRSTPSARQYEAELAFRGAGLRSSDRQGLEPPEAIRAMTAERLAAFYRRWYRPENAVIVVVGDQPPEAMLRLIDEAFSSWSVPGPAPEPPAAGEPRDEAGPRVQVVADGAATPTVEVCRTRKADYEPIVDVASLRRRMLPYVWAGVLNHRFQRLASGRRPAFVAAAASFSDDGREAAYACVDMALIAGDWKGALAAAETELRRFAAHGASQAEVTTALNEVRDQMLSGALRYGDRDSKVMADELADSDLRGEVFPSPQEAWRGMDVAMQGIRPAQAKAQFDRDWGGAGPFLSLWSPAPPAAEAVQAAWAKASSGGVPPALTEAPAAAWAYGDFGAAGRVVRREAFHNPDYMRLTFANGVVLKLMRTDFDHDRTEIRVRFGAGRRELADRDFNLALFGQAMLPVGGLGKHDFETLRSLFAGKSWSVELQATENAFVLSGRTSPWDLASELQLLAAFCDDPGFRKDIDARLPTAVSVGYQLNRTAPATAMFQAMYAQLWPGAPSVLPPEETARRWRTADFARVLKPPLTRDPLEVTIVGDVEEADAIALAASTFGALPPRRPSPPPRQDAWFRRFPEPGAGATPEVKAAIESSQSAAVGLVWPLYVASPERRREEFALQIVGRVLADSLMARVRQGLGKTYTPQVQVDMPDLGDQGMMMAVLDAAPADVDLVRQEMRAAAQRLAEGGIDAAALERARQPILADYEQRTRTNALWAAALTAARDEPQVLSEVLSTPAMLRSITLEEVRRAAATWLTRPPIVLTALPGEKR